MGGWWWVGGGGLLECNAPLNAAFSSRSSLPGRIIGLRMAEEPLRKQTAPRRRVKQPPPRPQPSHSSLTLNGAISRSLLRSPAPDEKRRGCDGRSNYEAAAEEPKLPWKQMPGQGGGGAWGGAGLAVGPRRQTLLDTIQSERSSVAVSTFPSASKCQPMFAGKHTVRV